MSTTRLSPSGVPGRPYGDFTHAPSTDLTVAGANATAVALTPSVGGVFLTVAGADADVVVLEPSRGGINASLAVVGATATATALVPSPPTGPAWWSHRFIGRW